MAEDSAKSADDDNHCISKSLCSRAGVIARVFGRYDHDHRYLRVANGTSWFPGCHRLARVFEPPERAKWQKPDHVVSALNPKPGQTVVDIGTEAGYFTRRFAHPATLSVSILSPA